MIYAGTIIEINNNKTFVFTMDYSVVAIRTKKDYILGQQITFSKRDKYTDLYLLGSGTLKVLALTAAAFLLITALTLSGVLDGIKSAGSFDEICTALVSVDINPSIEISINKDKQIVAAEAVNEDGVRVLETLELKHKPLKEGVKEIVNAAGELGYIDETTNVVLVSAAIYGDIPKTVSEDYAGQLKEILSSLEGGNEAATVLTVFIDDPKIIDDAKNNNLSIGKELLYKYAQTQEDGLTADDIRGASISELLDKLNALEQDGKLTDSIKNSGYIQSNYELTPAPEPEAATTPAASQTPLPTTEPADSAVSSNEPSDHAVPTQPSQEVNEGEVTESEDPIVTANPTKAPEPTEAPKVTAKPKEEVKSEIAPDLKVTTDGDTIDFSWTQLDSNNVTYNGKAYHGFLYYKVVASATNKHPIYPDDGYLAVISDKWENEWSVNPAEGDYNYSPELISGETYYFSITYVFENGKFTSDTETVQLPEYSEEIPDETISSLQLAITSDEDSLTFTWSPLDSSSITYGGEVYWDFNYYKIVASQTNEHPKYPEDGYLTFISDCYENTWTVTPSDGDYNYSPELISGETYYFSITYVFGNGKLCSNTVRYTVP